MHLVSSNNSYYRHICVNIQRPTRKQRGSQCAGLAVFLSVKVKGIGVSLHAMKAYQGAQLKLHPLLTLALDVGELSASCPCFFTPTEKPHQPMNRRLGRPHSQSEQIRKEKNVLPVPEIHVNLINDLCLAHVTMYSLFERSNSQTAGG